MNLAQKRIGRYAVVILHMVFWVSCATRPQPNPPAPEEEDGKSTVMVQTALEQARASYILGCMHAFKAQEQKRRLSFCSQGGNRHFQDLQEIMGIAKP